MTPVELNKCESLEDQFKTAYILLPKDIRPLMIQTIETNNQLQNEYFEKLDLEFMTIFILLNSSKLRDDWIEQSSKYHEQVLTLFKANSELTWSMT